MLKKIFDGQSGAVDYDYLVEQIALLPNTSLGNHIPKSQLFDFVILMNQKLKTEITIFKIVKINRNHNKNFFFNKSNQILDAIRL